MLDMAMEFPVLGSVKPLGWLSSRRCAIPLLHTPKLCGPHTQPAADSKLQRAGTTAVSPTEHQNLPQHLVHTAGTQY